MSTKIEWTQGPDGSKGETWNFIKGCSRDNAECDHCYAMHQVHRKMHASDVGLTKIRPKGSARPGVDWTGKITVLHERLGLPLRWKRPRRIFVNSMSDLFHPGVPFEVIAAALGVMAATPRHIYQILTKRPERALEFFSWLAAGAPEGREVERCVGLAEDTGVDFKDRIVVGTWPLPNVHLGVSAGRQETADEKIPLLLQCPAAVHWVSAGPLIGPVDFTEIPANLPPSKPGESWDYFNALTGQGVDSQSGERSGSIFPRISWVVVEGESGRSARPMHPDWARSIRDQCVEAGTAYFFKQWGAYAPWVTEEWYTHGDDEKRAHTWVSPDGRWGHCWLVDDDGSWSNHTGDPPIDELGRAAVAVMSRIGKKAAGRVLDGRTWDEMPASVEWSG